MNRYTIAYQLAMAGLLGLSTVIAGCGGSSTTSTPGTPITPSTGVTTTLLGGTGGGTFSAAVSINNGGLIVGSYDVGTMQAAKWDVANPSFPQVGLLPLTGGNYSAAYSINDASITVGEANDAPAGIIKAVTWAAGSTAAVTLNQDTLTGNNAAYGINATNMAVGEADIGGVTTAVLWSSLTAAPVTLAHLGTVTPCSSAYFISNEGVIAGESRDDAGVLQAVVWKPTNGVYGAPLLLAKLADNQAGSVALGVDANGNVVGEAELADGVLHGMVWDAAGAKVSDLGAATSAQAINNIDRIVGFVDALSGVEHAAIWSRTNISDKRVIDPTSQAFGVNNASTFVGVKDNHAFVAKSTF
ncbi:MAG: hypothetical protein Q7U91_16730 [Sideroxyarcus sp.]|nr:hypothetical protein [Sideroxyarcus sp.]